MELNQLTISTAAELIKKKEISSLELTKACLERIKKIDSKISAFLEIEEEDAKANAQAADKIISSGEYNSPLTGIPLAIKDNILVEGMKATAGSRILENYQSCYDATVVEKLRSAGAIILGKTNMDEFGMGSSTENSAFFKTKNPWDLTRTPGGSSGGSAAAVASDECIFALGSDTGSSVRQPASFCGIVGIKPTYGRVSRYGLIALASSLDQIGPLTKDVKDAALVLKVIAGKDPKDSTSKEVQVENYPLLLEKEIKGLKIGIPQEFFIEGMDEELAKAVKKAIAKFESLGAKIQAIHLPSPRYALAAYHIILPAEASANLARYDGIRYGYSEQNVSSAKDPLFEVYSKSRSLGLGEEVKRRIMLGTFTLSSGYYDAYYKRAWQVRKLIQKEYAKIFEKVDLIAAPTTPSVAFKLGEKLADPLAMYFADIYTVSANLVNIPAISIPCGLVNNLPAGLQLMGKPFSENLLFQAAYHYEKSTKGSVKKPLIQ